MRINLSSVLIIDRTLILNEPRHEKHCLRGSDTNRAVQPQKMTSGLESRGIVLPMQRKQCADQRAADLYPCFRMYAKYRFSHDEFHITYIHHVKKCK